MLSTAGPPQTPFPRMTNALGSLSYKVSILCFTYSKQTRPIPRPKTRYHIMAEVHPFSIQSALFPRSSLMQTQPSTPSAAPRRFIKSAARSRRQTSCYIRCPGTRSRLNIMQGSLRHQEYAHAHKRGATIRQISSIQRHEIGWEVFRTSDGSWTLMWCEKRIYAGRDLKRHYRRSLWMEHNNSHSDCFT